MIEQNTKKLQILGQVLNLVLQNKTVNVVQSPTVIVPDDGYAGLSSVTVESTPFKIELQDKEVFPARAAQVVVADKDYQGLNSVTILGESNLIPANIKSGVKIFDVTGSYLGEDANFQEKTIVPTGDVIIVLPDKDYNALSSVVIEGDANLQPQNIAEGIVIYGVEGTLKIGTAKSLPEEYASYIEHAKLLYTGEYKNYAVSENNSYLNVIFMTSGFSVTEYNETTTAFAATGWVLCRYQKSGENWDVTDHRETANTIGGNYVKNIRFSTVPWEYNGSVIWPWSVEGTSDATATPDKVVAPYTYYANGQKHTGTLQIEDPALLTYEEILKKCLQYHDENVGAVSMYPVIISESADIVHVYYVTSSHTVTIYYEDTGEFSSYGMYLYSYNRTTGEVTMSECLTQENEYADNVNGIKYSSFNIIYNDVVIFAKNIIVLLSMIGYEAPPIYKLFYDGVLNSEWTMDSAYSISGNKLIANLNYSNAQNCYIRNKNSDFDNSKFKKFKVVGNFVGYVSFYAGSTRVSEQYISGNAEISLSGLGSFNRIKFGASSWGTYTIESLVFE